MRESLACRPAAEGAAPGRQRSAVLSWHGPIALRDPDLHDRACPPPAERPSRRRRLFARAAALSAAPDSLPRPRLELRGITKVWPGVLANDRIDLDVLPGEIHAVLGE